MNVRAPYSLDVDFVGFFSLSTSSVRENKDSHFVRSDDAVISPTYKTIVLPLQPLRMLNDCSTVNTRKRTRRSCFPKLDMVIRPFCEAARV